MHAIQHVTSLMLQPTFQLPRALWDSLSPGALVEFVHEDSGRPLVGKARFRSILLTTISYNTNKDNRLPGLVKGRSCVPP